MPGDVVAIWYADPASFITSENYNEILPTGEMTYARQLNSVMRLMVYFGLLVLLVGGRTSFLALPVATAGVTYAMYTSFVGARGDELDGFDAPPCVLPTYHNPFMNVLQSDEATRPPACSPLIETVAGKVADMYGDHGVRDRGDPFWSDHSRFMTTPSTTTPNDQTSFAEWCYGEIRAGGRPARPPRDAGASRGGSQKRKNPDWVYGM